MEKILQSIERALYEIRDFIKREPTDARVGIVRTVALTVAPFCVMPEDGAIVGWFISNSRAAPVYIKLYDYTNEPAVGVSPSRMTVMLPASSAANVAFPGGIQFKNGIWAVATLGYADSDTTSPNAGEVIVNLFLKGN